MTPLRGHLDRRFRVVLAATILCFSVGYPLALVGHSNFGWVLVTLGGPLLIMLVILTIREVHQGAEADRGLTGADPGSPPPQPAQQ